MLQGNEISDDGLARLKGKERLKGLFVGPGTACITDSGLAHLRGCDKLETLELQHSKVTVQGLEHLKALPCLKELWLTGPDISLAKGRSLLRAIP